MCAHLPAYCMHQNSIVLEQGSVHAFDMYVMCHQHSNSSNAFMLCKSVHQVNHAEVKLFEILHAHIAGLVRGRGLLTSH